MTAPQLGGTDPAELRIDHEVVVDPRTGRVGVRVPLDLSPGRQGIGPAPALTHSSSAAAGPYGTGWSLDGVPVIGDRGQHAARAATYDSRDAYALNLTGDLVPMVVETPAGWMPRVAEQGGYTVRYWRPRREAAHIRIEQWIDGASGVGAS